jgi:ABC-type sugar transport system permease subunit
VRYSLLVIALTFLPPVMLAILLQEVPRGKIFFRTIFYLPAVITSLVTILLWKSFYGKEEHGLLNAVLLRVPAWVYIVAGLFLLVVAMAFARRLFHHGSKWSALAFVAAGVIVCYTVWDLAAPVFEHHTGPLWTGLFAAAPPSEARDWLGDSRTAMFCCVLPMVWAGIGPGCLIYLAALKSVSNDLYEVADIDGATFVDKILFVIFPMLKALLIINFVGVFIGSWKATAGILAMTDGTANTEVAGLHIFHESFYHLRFGPATAMAWVLGFLLIGFTVNQLRLLSRMEFRTVDSAKKG